VNETDILDLGRETILVALKVGAPAMLLALVVGVAISVLQALTQIQEQTLTFMPKIIAVFLALLVLMPFMVATLGTFTQHLVDRIIAIQ
jgi:flagellar biosynthetic protein FliQ